MPLSSKAVQHRVRYYLSRTLSSRSNNLKKAPIPLYWWINRKNFGDALSPLVVSYLTGREVRWTPVYAASLFAIGSIYGWVCRKNHKRRSNLHVWGSGLKKPSEMVHRPTRITHHLVRGPLTAAEAGDEKLPFGDPGVLAPDVFQLSKARDAKGFGLIPHIFDWSRKGYINSLASIPGCRLIDFRSDDCRSIIQEVASCERVYSSSLHGLILADALGLPNFRFEGPDPDYKFLDYGLSVGRDLEVPVNLAEHIKQTRLSSVETAHFENLSRLKKTVAESFPYDVFGGDQAIAANLAAR
ncbi:MAG: hypothetical protein AAGJ81_14345 [Verrucomicrobiota bacterium]